MEDKKSERNDQEKELTELLMAVNHQNVENNNQSIEEQEDLLLDEEENSQLHSEDKTMNVLNLPPRKEVHSQKKNRTHLKISRPFIRLFIVVLLLLAVISLLLFYNDGVLNF